MKSFWQHIMYLSHAKQRGIVVLILALLATMLIPNLHRNSRLHPCETHGGDSLHQKQQNEVKAFIASIQKKHNRASRPTAGHIPPTATARPQRTLFAFDPNLSDSITFRKLGLPGWMAHNILKYREKGGQFRKKEDFKKIYGLKEEEYALLSPYIQIAPLPAEEKKEPEKPLSLLAETPDSIQHRAVEKYAPGTVIELNSADTTELKKIPGIGSHIARRITGYRQRLGGFYRLEQLKEIQIRYELLQPWFRIDTSLIRRIPVNRTSIERLRRHPYIGFYRAKALVEYRKKTGPIHSLKPFSLLDDFTEEDLQRITPYLDFSSAEK